MVADDTYYLTPHEAALAVVATAMKKARLQINILTLNALLGGVLFSSGAIMSLAAHSENYGLMQENPGVINSFSGILFGIGLFYVVIMGADLFNSNILFFSVGLLRGAVTVFDLLVSWSVSLIGNLASSVFVAYVFCHLSKVSSSEAWKSGSRSLVESKASFSFVENFLKGIAGNFFVCLAIYLQLMAKPLHVRLILTILPIFTFVSCGFIHVVADMVVSFVGMLNGASVSVGEYIWKLLIPTAVGNVVGGFTFSLVVPFYLHLVVVESDRKRLSLPEYDARDEQPELNTDSRVVRISPLQEQQDELDNEAMDELDSYGKGELNERDDQSEASTGSSSSLSPNASRNSSESNPHEYTPSDYAPPVSRTATNRSGRSMSSRRSTRSFLSLRPFNTRSPPGVFPVRGMGEPLRREKTIQNPYFAVHETNEQERQNRRDSLGKKLELHRPHLATSKSFSATDSHRESGRSSSDYNALDDRPGAKLEKAITRLVENSQKSKVAGELPRTTQETFPHNRPSMAPSHSTALADLLMRQKVNLQGSSLWPKKDNMNRSDVSSIERSLRRAGITHRAAAGAQSVAGVANFADIDFYASRSGRGSHDRHLPHTTSHLHSAEEVNAPEKANSVSIGSLQNENESSAHRPT